jgi:hypothetical protein
VAGVPDLLTVEEAARLIRVGRTKAYAMTREWRATGGRSGLPVVDFGNVLRVPRHALEQLIGARLESSDGEAGAGSTGAGAPTPVTASSEDCDATSTTARARSGTRTPRRRSRPADQPTLPFAS